MKWIVPSILLFSIAVQGQTEYLEYYDESQVINNIGMGVLGGWALANMSLGAYGWNQSEGQESYFHQMNLFWNTVNLTIAGFALYGNLSSDYRLLPGEELLEMQLKTQRIFLINGALDVGYVATGFLLKYLAPKYPKNELRLQGYGNSVILQGSFLFIFDLVMYGLLRSHRAGFLDQLSFSPMENAWGMALSFQF
ncbi:MAG: hypothetical protein R6W31_10620 [Bacteroidales bacterium]